MRVRIRTNYVNLFYFVGTIIFCLPLEIST